MDNQMSNQTNNINDQNQINQNTYVQPQPTQYVDPMQNNYQQPTETQYDGFGNENKSGGKTALIIILVILLVAGLAVGGYFLYTKVIKKDKSTTPTTREINETYRKASNSLYDFGLAYYNDDSKLPLNIGECTEVTLKELKEKNLVSEDFDQTCDEEKTYVKACKLESGDYHYSTNLYCENDKLKSEYSDWKKGNETDLTNETYDVKFKYKLEALNGDTTNITNDEQEVWKDELSLAAGTYKVVTEQTYYRYRDLLYKWEITKDHYYQKNGTNDLTNALKVSEYYPTSPSSAYNNKNNATKVYKWYTYSSDVYNNGEYLMAKPNNNYPVPNNPKDFITYDTETLPQNEYTTKETVYQRKTGDTWDTTYTNEQCTNEELTNSTCRSIFKYTATKYQWFTNSKKTYYPSGSTTASGETTYYAKAPLNQAIKDETTETTGYKWYKKVTYDLGYAKEAPQRGAVKVQGQTKWTEWSSYTPNKVAQTTTRQVETRTKLIIKPSTTNETDTTKTDYINITNGYVELEEMLKLANEKGYNVNSLNDITNNPKLKYSIAVYYRTITN